MHANIRQRGSAARALRLGVTTSAVGVTLAFGMAGQADAAEGEVVQVESGDTLAEIAAEQGLDPTNGWRRIAAATPNIGDPDTIVPGQHVRVPPPAESGGAETPTPSGEADAGASAPQATTAVVQPGDTLAEIAAAHDVGSWRRIFDANPHVANPNVVVAGQELRIPAPGEDLPRRPLPQPEPTPSSGGAAVQQQANTSQGTPSEDPGQQEVGASASASDPPTQSQPSTSAGGGVWERLAQCESGGNWNANTGNGFYGGLQFTPSSWRAVGGDGLPHQASKGEQIARAQRLQAQQGWGAWPACSRQLGLR